MLIIQIVNIKLLSGYYQNVRELKTKLSSIQLNMPSLLYFDYFILVETWLNSDISDSELNMHDYNIFRMDRTINNSIHNICGGVLITVHKNFHSRLLPSYDINCEQLCFYYYQQ